MILFDTYKIGGGKRRPHWAHRWHVDRWFRSWQCEWHGDPDPACLRCPRAWTKAGALRKGRRWCYRYVDIRKAEREIGTTVVAREFRDRAIEVAS